MAGGLTAHHDYDHLLRRMAASLSRADSLREVVYRCSEPTYATKADLLTEGSRLYGGRWNPPSSFATVYSAYTEFTAIAESKAHYIYYRLDPVDALPRTIVAVDVGLSKVLDLTTGAIRKGLGVSATRMRSDDWRKFNRGGAESLTQAMGRAAYESGLEGLIVPACDGKRNLIWFPGNLLAGSSARIRNVHKL